MFLHKRCRHPVVVGFFFPFFYRNPFSPCDDTLFSHSVLRHRAYTHYCENVKSLSVCKQLCEHSTGLCSTKFAFLPVLCTTHAQKTPDCLKELYFSARCKSSTAKKKKQVQSCRISKKKQRKKLWHTAQKPWAIC